MIMVLRYKSIKKSRFWVFICLKSQYFFEKQGFIPIFAAHNLKKQLTMAVKIRLQRHGKKDAAFFHVVVADGRAPRDGKFIEKLGIYNPNSNPATIDINFDKTLSWIQKGAQPTDTCRAILSYKGVMFKKHLLEGVKKGALTEAQAEQKFNKWLEEKTSKIGAKKENVAGAKTKAQNERLKAETAKKEAKAAKIAAKTSEVPAAEVKGETTNTDGAQETPSSEETNN